MLKKLKSQAGASLAIALVFLMMCTVTGAVILSAAGTASGKDVGVKKERQTEYSLSSAGRVLLSQLQGQELEKITKIGQEEGSTEEIVSEIKPQGELGDFLLAAAQNVKEKAAQNYKLKLSVAGKPALAVTASCTMNEDYSMSIELADSEQTIEQTMKYKIEIPAASRLHEDKDLMDENGKKYTRTVWTVRWGEGTLRKVR
ncbi:MAG: hypothetical protein Q4D60_05785 [Eubacteriales bacterium]|nr:hypothetical protein [Eubacteriales bacterium]